MGISCSAAFGEWDLSDAVVSEGEGENCKGEGVSRCRSSCFERQTFLICGRGTRGRRGRAFTDRGGGSQSESSLDDEQYGRGTRPILSHAIIETYLLALVGQPQNPTGRPRSVSQL